MPKTGHHFRKKLESLNIYIGQIFFHSKPNKILEDPIENFFEKIIFVIFRAEKPKFFRRKAKKSSNFGLDFFFVI